jgi:hypothetical protein
VPPDQLAEWLAWQLQNDPALQAIVNARQGITDGSEALAGEVGQFLSGQAQVSVPQIAPGNIYPALLTPLTLPAGDWLVTAYGYSPSSYAGADFSLSGAPGLSTNMVASLSVTAGGFGAVLNSIPARARLSGTSGLVFDLALLGISPFSLPGVFTLQVQAWRMR